MNGAHVLLATPVIWSQILNFDEMWTMGAKLEWIAELLRRTGRAPLDIKAENGMRRASARDTTHCLFDILRKNWFRVRNLVLRVSDQQWGLQNVLLWDWMYTPAPQLEVFDVDFGIDSLKASPSIYSSVWKPRTFFALFQRRLLRLVTSMRLG